MTRVSIAITYRCDNCGKEETVQIANDPQWIAAQYQRPQGWRNITLSGVERDYCSTECFLEQHPHIRAEAAKSTGWTRVQVDLSLVESDEDDNTDQTWD